VPRRHGLAPAAPRGRGTLAGDRRRSPLNGKSLAGADAVPTPMGPHFINVDLEVWSRSDLSVLAKAVEPVALVLYVGKTRRKHLVAFEAQEARLSSPEATIWALLKVIKALPPKARRVWKSAESRVFNVGYQAEGFVTLLHERSPGSGRWYAKDPRKAAKASVTTFSPELVQAVARAGGTITTTIYPPTRQMRPRRTSSRLSGRRGPANRALQRTALARRR